MKLNSFLEFLVPKNKACLEVLVNDLQVEEQTGQQQSYVGAETQNPKYPLIFVGCHHLKL